MGNKEAVKKLLGMLKGYRKIIALIIACLLISTGLNMCIPLLSRGIMDYGFIGGDKELLIKQVIGSLLIYMMIAVIDIIKEKKRVDISANIQYSLSEQSFQRLMRIKANYFSSKSVAAIIPTYRRKNNIKWYRYFGVCFERIQKYGICSKPGDLSVQFIYQG